MKNEFVVKMMARLVDFQKTLETQADVLRKFNVFKFVSRTSSFIEYPNSDSPAFSSSLNADLIEPINDDLHCLSFSFTFFINKSYKWEVHTELGWSSYNYGFEDEKLMEKEFESIEDMLEYIPKLTEDYMSYLNYLVERLTQ